MTPCDYCHQTFEPSRAGQRFCRDRCRSAWHRAQHLPGQVAGIRAINRGWSVTVHVPDLPDGIKKGSAVRLETTENPRLDASTGVKI